MTFTYARHTTIARPLHAPVTRARYTRVTHLEVGEARGLRLQRGVVLRRQLERSGDALAGAIGGRRVVGHVERQKFGWGLRRAESAHGSGAKGRASGELVER